MHGFYHSFHALLAIKKDVKEIYANRFIQQLALSLIGVFIPVYLLDLNYTLFEVLFFLALYYFFMGIFSFLGVFAESKLGGKHTVGLTVPFYIAFFASLFSLEFFRLPLIFVAGLYAVAQQLYWVPTNTEFAKFSDFKSRGSEIGLLATIPRLAAIASPLLGSLILSSFSQGFLFLSNGFEVLFVVVSFLLVFSVVPLFLTPDYKPSIAYNWKKVFSKKNFAFFDAFAFQGVINTVVSFLWPLHVFLCHGEYVVVGAAASSMMVGLAVFNMLVGWLSDKVKKTTLVFAGGISFFLVMVLAFFASSVFEMIVVSVLIGFSTVLINLPLFAEACDEANKENIAEFIVFREVGLSAGRTIQFLFAISIALLFHQNFYFELVFLLPAFTGIYLAFTKK
jgi:MFS family permease